jgi:hypothetical protein
VNVPPEIASAPVSAPVPAVTYKLPVASIFAVFVKPVVPVGEVTMPREVVAVPPLAATVRLGAANAGATDVRTPSPSDATATSATRLKFVFVDMFFLSLVRFRNFLSLARRSFDLLIPYPVAHTCNAAKIRKSI